MFQNQSKLLRCILNDAKILCKSVRYKSDQNSKSKKLMNAFHACLYKNLKNRDVQDGNKVSLVGTGPVGMGCSIALLSKGVTNNLVLYDFNKELCGSERMNLLYGSMFLHNCHIDQSSDIKSTKNSRVVVVTVGSNEMVDENELQVAQKTANILKTLMPALVEQSPKAIYIIVTNQSDVMTWVAQKLTNLPYEQCFSSGCHLDTSRFRMFISHILGISAQSVHGYVIGQHGEASVPMWSSVSVGGVRLKTLHPTIGTEKDSMRWSSVHKEIVKAAYNIKSFRDYTNWAVGLTVADIISAIFHDSNRILTLSTNAKGICDIEDEIFLSLPCVVNKSGLSAIIRPQLSGWEICALKKSAEQLHQVQCDIKL